MNKTIFSVVVLLFGLFGTSFSQLIAVDPPRGDSNQPCRNPVNCWANPCQFSSCPAYPQASCVFDNCGGCFAKYYLNGRQVDCEGPREEPIEEPTVEGECPFDWLGSIVRCGQPGRDQCNQCERRGKLCCPHGCGQMCKNPVRRPRQTTTVRTPRTVEGVCPFDELGTRVRCAGPPRDQCGDCASQGKLCCNHGCTRICKEPETQSTPRPTSDDECPVQEAIPICFAFGPDECNNCEERGQRCCPHMCGQKCKDPVRTQEPTPVQGECPVQEAIPMCFAFGPDECNNCEAIGQRCCPHMCGQKCKDPVRRQEPTPIQGECPYDDLLPRVLCQGPQVDRCYGQCEQQGKLCCSNGCNKICKDPIIIDPPRPVEGYCPFGILRDPASCVAQRDECNGQCERQGKLVWRHLSYDN